jgi:hypothetical protein
LGTAGTASGTDNGTLTVSGTATGSKSVSAYARLTSSGTTCQSANAATVTAVVNPIPTITLRSATGTVNQTVNAGTEMTAISYTATNSGTFTKTGDFPAGVTGSANGSSYTISGTPTATGTFGYSLTAEVGGCSSDAAVGTISVNAAHPSGNTPVTLCPQCCYNGATWVDCYVTTDPVSTATVWVGEGVTTHFTGASGSGSEKNGRKNFEAITANPTAYTSTSAVGLCKALGDGWYLPAYEELYAMSSGVKSGYSNNQDGAQLLDGGYHRSSTEYYSLTSRGRYSSQDVAFKPYIVHVGLSGTLMAQPKGTIGYYVRCAWRL